MFDSTEHPYRRVNPLTGESVLVSPHQQDLTAEQVALRLRARP